METAQTTDASDRFDIDEVTRFDPPLPEERGRPRSFESVVEDFELAIETFQRLTEGKTDSQEAFKIKAAAATAMDAIGVWREA